MADPIILDTSRNIYEGFWRQGMVPLTKTIRVLELHGENARVQATCFDIPSEILNEWTIDGLQADIDRIYDTPMMVFPKQ